MPRSALYEKSKFLGSGGSMVARLKLKEIDGRAPPGVNRSSSAPNSSPIRVRWFAVLKMLVRLPRATPSNCGEVLKSLNYQVAVERRAMARVMTSGTVTTFRMSQ